MLEKLGAQNIAAFENQGKQCEVSDHWEFLKEVFLKKKQAMTQKRQEDWQKYKF